MIFKRLKDTLFNTSIRKKLLSSYVIIISALSILLMLVIMYSLFLNAQYNRVLVNFSHYNNINNTLDSINQDLYNYITEQKSIDETAQLNTISYINTNINSIKYNPKNEDFALLIQLLRGNVESIKSYIETSNKLIQSKSEFKERMVQYNSTVEASSLLKSTIQQLMTLDVSHSQEMIKNIKSSFYVTLTIIILLFLVTIAFSIFYLLAVTVSITDKISKISVSANKLADGVLTGEEIVFNTKDEFQILAHSFNKMKNNIKEYIGQISYNEKRISSILNGISGCVVSTDPEGIIESCNYAIKEMFSYEPDEIIGQNINLIIPEFSCNKGVCVRIPGKTLTQYTSIVDGKHQFLGVKKDESDFPIEVGFSEIDFEDKKVKILIIQDISERKVVEKMKDEFISVVSHELRTPLTSINGSLSLIINGILGDVSEKAQEMLCRASSNCSRLITLINDILDLNKIASGKMEFNIESVDLGQILNQALDETKSYAQQYNVKCLMIGEVPDIQVDVDKNRFMQVLINILSNAVKFTENNVPVEIITSKDNDKTRIAITNYGVEIDEEYRGKIFQKFSQADSSNTRKKGGSGLGLSISKSIMENLNGDISFESANGKTTFFIDLF